MLKLLGNTKKTIVFASAFAAMMLFSAKSYAIFGLFGDIAIPVIEPVSTASELAKDISVGVTKVKAALDRAKQEIGNSYTAKLFNYSSKFNLKAPYKPTAGAKGLVVPGIADPYIESDVKKAIYKLFLKYPSHDIPTQVRYREESREFYDDTVVEVYSAAREVERYLATDIAAKFANLQDRLSKSGGDGASAPDAKNEVLYNDYLAYQTIDSIAAVLQEVTAIRSQLQAAKAIRDTVEPLEYKDNNQCSLWDHNEPVQIASEATVSGNSGVAFAQVQTGSQEEENPDEASEIPENPGPADEPSLSPSDLPRKPAKANVPACAIDGVYQVNVDEDCYNEDEDMYKPFEDYEPISPDGDLTFVESDDPKLEHPYYDARYKINELERMELVYNKLQVGIKSHNLIKRVRLVKDDIENYKKMVLLHEKAKRRVKIVDQCAITMLKNNFANPETVWCGQASCSDILENPEMRSGISGWAMEAYAVGKNAMSEETSSLNIPNMPLPTEDDIQSKKTENVEKEGIPYVEKHQDEILAAVDIKQAETIARKGEMLPWRIGAMAAKALSENSSAWGTVSNPYPVWNDQKNFYSQYLDGKYENLPIYLQYRTQARVYARALPVVNDFLKQVGIKKAEKAQEEEIKNINDNKKLKAGEKADQISKVKAETQATIKQYEEDAKNNLSAISNIAGLSDESIFPELKKINTKGIDPADVDVFKLGSSVTSLLASGTSKLLTLGSVSSYSMGVTEATMLMIKERIKAFRDGLCSRGDSLYNEGAVDDHQNLLRELDLYVYVLSAEDVKVDFKPLEGLILSMNNSEDDQYFVGVKALTEREVRAPKKPAEMGYAPLREIFHFDDVDRDNSQPGTAQAFLNHGGDIPAIWKVMLQPKPFVQKKFYLNKVLNSPTNLNIKINGVLVDGKPLSPQQLITLVKDPGLNTLVRGGTFPCNITGTLANTEKTCMDNIIFNLENATKGVQKSEKCGGTYFDDKVLGGLDNRRSSLTSVFSYIQTPANYKGGSVNPCVGITLNINAENGKMMDKGHGFEKLFGIDLYNERAGDGFITAENTLLNSLPPSMGRSELGIFFEAVDPDPSNDEGQQTMKFRQSFLEIYEAIEGLESEELEDKDKNVKSDILSNIPFQTNQIGAFLSAAEDEQEYRKSREEMAKAIAQVEADVVATLKEIGMNVGTTFSLVNPDDYNLSMDSLKGLKSQMIKEIESGISDVKVKDNKVVKYRLREFKRMLIALQKDNGEYVTIAEGVDSGPEFDEIIKMEKANLEVHDKYREEGDKAFEQALRDLSSVYCANYNEGAYDKNKCKFYK